MKIYERNGKNEKALAVCETIYEQYKEMEEPNTLTFLLKQKYMLQTSILDLPSRDAELTLLNIINIIVANLNEY